jgi:hypothetical protein
MKHYRIRKISTGDWVITELPESEVEMNKNLLDVVCFDSWGDPYVTVQRDYPNDALDYALDLINVVAKTKTKETGINTFGTLYLTNPYN